MRELASGWSWISKTDFGCHRFIEPDDACAYRMIREQHGKMRHFPLVYSTIANNKINPTIETINPSRHYYKNQTIDIIHNDGVNLFQKNASEHIRFLLVLTTIMASQLWTATDIASFVQWLSLRFMGIFWLILGK